MNSRFSSTFLYFPLLLHIYFCCVSTCVVFSVIHQVFCFVPLQILPASTLSLVSLRVICTSLRLFSYFYLYYTYIIMHACVLSASCCCYCKCMHCEFLILFETHKNISHQHFPCTCMFSFLYFSLFLFQIVR